MYLKIYREVCLRHCLRALSKLCLALSRLSKQVLYFAERVANGGLREKGLRGLRWGLRDRGCAEGVCAEGCTEGIGEGVVKLSDPKFDRFRRRVALFQAPLFS